ncbi:hypothetical protein POY92_19900, partial [Phocaeicola vulgatus]|nr:hypothetical protein [Phocaeicola vulgatus]
YHHETLEELRDREKNPYLIAVSRNTVIAFILDSGEFSGNVVQGYILFLPENARKGQNDFISQKYFLSLQLL